MFKKIFFGMAALAMLTACNEDFTDWANPQQNEEPTTVSFGDGSITEVGLIDLNNVDTTIVQVCQIKAPTSSAVTYTPEYKINIGDNSYDISSNGEMTVAELNDYIHTVYGMNPIERDLTATVEMWLNNGTSTVKTATSAAFTIRAIGIAPVIYEHLYVIGAPSEWSPTCTSLPFTHSGKDVYEDPEFTVMFPATEGENWFAFADDQTVANNSWSDVFAAKEGNGLNKVGEKGELCRRSELSEEAGDGSFKVTVDGDAKFIKVTVNMLERTYLIEKINFQPYIYYVGTANGWDNSASGVSMKLKLTDANTGTYSGYVYCKEESYGNTFRFLKNYGDWNDTYGSPNVTSYDGPMEAGSSDGNFNATAGTGVYYLELSIAKGTMKAVKINNMNLVGDFNGWNQADDAQQMTWDAENFCYVITGAGVNANGWKFTANNAWDINLGGTTTDLVANGDNLSAVGTTIKLYPCRTTNDNIYCTVE